MRLIGFLHGRGGRGFDFALNDVVHPLKVYIAHVDGVDGFSCSGFALIELEALVQRPGPAAVLSQTDGIDVELDEARVIRVVRQDEKCR